MALNCNRFFEIDQQRQNRPFKLIISKNKAYFKGIAFLK